MQRRVDPRRVARPGGSRAAKYQPRKIIAVDVDGTLLVDGQPNETLIEWLREQRAEGYRLILWSARGEEHARNAARVCECSDLFDHILSKPGYVVDDDGWGWIKYTRIVNGKNIALKR